MSNGAPTVEKAKRWVIVAAFGDQLVIDPEANLRDLALIQARSGLGLREIRVGVIRDDEKLNEADPVARWDLKTATPDEVTTALADAREITDTLNRALGQVVR